MPEITDFFPFLTIFVSFLFMLSILEQWYRKRKTHQLVWAAAMVLFVVTVFFEAWSVIFSWDILTYKVYYVLTGIQVSFMGGGVIYLFASRNMIQGVPYWFLLHGVIVGFFAMIYSPRSPILMWILVIEVGAILLGLVYLSFNILGKIRKSKTNISSWLDAKLNGTHFAHFFILQAVFTFFLMVIVASSAFVDSLQLTTGGKEIAGWGWEECIVNPATGQCIRDPGFRESLVRLFSPLFTVVGGIALIGGGIYSYSLWQWSIRKSKGHFEPKTGIFNIYISLGGFILASGGFLTGFGFPGALYLGEIVGVTFMYFGFLESDRFSKTTLIEVFTLGWLRQKTTKEPLEV